MVALPDIEVVRRNGAALGALAFYFCTSIALTMFNKWFFAEHPKPIPQVLPEGSSGAPTPRPAIFAGTYHFHFPLTVTCIHQWLVWLLLLAMEKRILLPLAGEVTRSWQLAVTICPIGMLCGIDWGLSNTSLRYIPLSLYEVVKSASPVFVLLVSFGLGMLTPNRTLILIVVVISFGMFLAVSGGRIDTFTKVDFPMQGFVCVCIATVLAGLRVVLAQRVMQKVAFIPASNGGKKEQTAVVDVQDDDDGNPFSGSHDRQPLNGSSDGKSGTNNGNTNNSDIVTVNAITTLYYAAPASASALVLPAYLVESREVMQYFRDEPSELVWGAVFWILVSSSVAFLLSISEFVVTRKTSALTLCVTGISKQVLIIGLAMMVFGDRLYFMNMVGFAITIGGIGAYNYHKLVLAQAAAKEEVASDGENDGTEMRPPRCNTPNRLQQRSHSGRVHWPTNGQNGPNTPTNPS